MIIELIEQKYTNGNSFKIKNTEYCCDGIKNNETIAMNYQDRLPAVCINSTEMIYFEGDDYQHDISIPIQYCPHCGKKISLNIVDTIDVSEKYEKLKEDLDILDKKYYETDSVKEREKISSELCKIRLKIQYIQSSFCKVEEEQI